MRRENGSNKAKRILLWFLTILLLVFFIPVLQIGDTPVTSEDRKVQRLIRYLQASEDEIIFDVVEKLGRSRDPRAIRALLAAMQDKDKNIRYFAVAGLGYTRDHRATKALLAAMSEGLNSRYEQSIVTRSLGRLRDPMALKSLLKLATNEFRENRLNAVRALGKFNDMRAFDALCAAMKDPDNDIRAAAAQAIAISGDSRSEDMLRSASNNDVFSRDKTSNYFALVPNGPGVAVLIAAFNNHDPKISMALVRAFRSLAKIQTKPEALAKVLREALENGPLDLRIRAADGLRSFKDDRTISVLIRATKDPDPMVRAESMKSLAWIHSDRADAEHHPEDCG
jgi:HEAT repeat protein